MVWPSDVCLGAPARGHSREHRGYPAQLNRGTCLVCTLSVHPSLSAIAAVLLAAPWPMYASAQTSDALGRPDAHVAEPDTSGLDTVRPLGERYADALAGTWAAIAIATPIAVAAHAGSFGASMCFFNNELCDFGFLVTGLAGGGIGWVVGAGLRARRGAGLDVAEGFAVWSLGFLSAAVVFGTSAGLSALPQELDSDSGTPWLLIGATVGGIAGALVQAFLAPFWAVLLFEDREPRDSDSVALSPYLSPTTHGATAGLGGVF